MLIPTTSRNLACVFRDTRLGGVQKGEVRSAAAPLRSRGNIRALAVSLCTFLHTPTPIPRRQTPSPSDPPPMSEKKPTPPHTSNPPSRLLFPEAKTPPSPTAARSPSPLNPVLPHVSPFLGGSPECRSAALLPSAEGRLKLRLLLLSLVRQKTPAADTLYWNPLWKVCKYYAVLCSVCTEEKQFYSDVVFAKLGRSELGAFRETLGTAKNNQSLTAPFSSSIWNCYYRSRCTCEFAHIALVRKCWDDYKSSVCEKLMKAVRERVCSGFPVFTLFVPQESLSNRTKPEHFSLTYSMTFQFALTVQRPIRRK